MFYVYIMTSGRNGTLYIGQTDNLNRRVFEHQSGAVPVSPRNTKPRASSGSRPMTAANPP